MTHRIAPLAAVQLERRLDRLVALLSDAVDSGAVPGSVATLAAADAVEYWLRVRAAIVRGTRILLADDEVSGVVEIDLGVMPSARHKAVVTKVFVRRDARGRGVGRALIEAAECAARAAGRTVLVLDPRAGEATARLYERLGYARQSAANATVSFYRELS